MAERRMFAKTIIDSDAFLDMPVTSQLLYFHLSMRADDDGFVNKPKSIVNFINAVYFCLAFTAYAVSFENTSGGRIVFFDNDAFAVMREYVVVHDIVDSLVDIDTAAVADKGIVKDISGRIISCKNACCFNCLSGIAELFAHSCKEVFKNINGGDHQSLDRNSAKGSFKMIPEAAYILMTSVKFDVVIIAVNHKVSVNICIAVDSAVCFKVSDTFYCIIETVAVASDKIIVTDDR